MIGALLLFGCGSDGKNGNPDGANLADGAVADSSVDAQVLDISTEELHRIVAQLASDEHAGREEGSAGGLAARQFLVAELSACGIEPLVGVSYEQPIAGTSGANLLGIIPGTDSAQSDRHVLISAHYDHLGQQGAQIYRGAYDNAAGVAAVLQVACSLAVTPPPRSVLVALWDAEEPPTFLSAQMGSQYFVENPPIDLSLIDVAIVLDLIGSNLWPGFNGQFVLGQEKSPQVSATLATITPPTGLEVFTVGLHLAEEQPGGHQPWSDYDAFRNAGIPNLFMTNGQNKQYHTTQDTVQNLDAPKHELETRYLLAVTVALANASVTPQFDAVREDYAADLASLIPVAEAALAPGGMVDTLGLSTQSRSTLSDDLAALRVLQTNFPANGQIGANDVALLRTAVQRVMCLAGDSYSEAMCGFL
jgi:Zn-dependent M28 family amino/carboxypeptidase